MKTLNKYISEGGFFSNVKAGSAEEAWLESAFSTGVFDEKLRPYIKIEHNGDSKRALIRLSVDKSLRSCVSAVISVNINDECFPGGELPNNINLIFDAGSDRADFRITGKYLKSFRGFIFTSNNMGAELYISTLNVYNIKVGSFDGIPMMKKFGWVYIGAADDYSKLSDMCWGVSVFQRNGVLTDIHKMLDELGYVRYLSLDGVTGPKYKPDQLVKDVEDYISRVTTEGPIDVVNLSSNKIKTYKNNEIKRLGVFGGVKVIDLSDNPLSPTAPDFELPVCAKSVRISSRIYAKIFGWKNQLKHQLSKDNVYKNIELIRTNY